MACGNAEHAIICGEKDVDHRLLSARELEGIVSAKPQGHQFLCPYDSDIRLRDHAIRSAKHLPDTGPPLATGRIVDFFLHHGTTEPLLCTSLAAPQDQENCFGFQSNTVLELIVKRSV